MTKAVLVALLALLAVPSALAGAGVGVAALTIQGQPAGPALPGVGTVEDSGVVGAQKSWTLNTGAFLFSCNGATLKGTVKNAFGEVIAVGVPCASSVAAGTPFTYNVQFGRFFATPTYYTMAGSIVAPPLP